MGKKPSELGLVLSGGGARGAYQAGVLKALSEISISIKLEQPFKILTGVSAGAINAAYWGANAHDIGSAGQGLANLWSKIEAENVFRTDFGKLSKIGSQWIKDITLGPIFKKHSARSFLDTEPLWKLLGDNIDFNKLDENLKNNVVSSLAISATDYTTNEAITFVQSAKPVTHWQRTQRRSQNAEIKVEHIMASSAIPLFFPPIPVDGEYFGDGALRNTSPLSPAVHLEAERLVVIGVRKQIPGDVVGTKNVCPSIGRQLNTVLNSILMDAIHTDVERLARINKTLSLIPEEKKIGGTLRPVEFVWVSPSEDIGMMAQEEAWRLPKLVHYLLGGLGSTADTSEIVSYLLFEPTFCQRLIDLGYGDTMARRDEMELFLLGQLNRGL